jgi:ribose 1,5-bisphosphokinase
MVPGLPRRRAPDRMRASMVTPKHDAARAGQLVYVVGPSGSGKDSLIAYARRHMPDDIPVVFAHRYITRPVRRDDENHVSLSDMEFALRVGRGCMAMHWASHGHSYGIGVEIDEWLACGLDVVVSGSREYLPRALLAYPDLALVLVTAPTDVLRNRLEARGRETPDSIDARLQRAVAHSAMPCRPALELLNDGLLDRAGAALVAYLCDLAAARRAG